MASGKRESLGNKVVPINYQLSLEPDLKVFKTKGTERISCKVRSTTRTIRLNAKELEIKDVRIIHKEVSQPATLILDSKHEQLELDFKNSVKGEVIIEIDFVCTNSDRNYGFYRSKYMNDGKERHILTSQFEAASARAAFPCFDEPGMKATFEVSMLIDEELDAISNMPVKKSENKYGKKLVTFEKSPIMSPYLLYLSVGNFDYIHDDLDGLKINVITTPGKKNLGELGMVYAKESVKWLQTYFGIKYPLPKLDYIAVPDFSAGAMENWGAITFRETAFLGDKNTALPNKQYKAEVIAHETVHQWFGDLVTMKWWDDIWLNESFAEFMCDKAMDSIHPNWKMLTQYVVDSVGGAFGADGLKNTHPISVTVNTPGDVDSIFDAISYNKGGSVLFMIEDYIGKEIFRKGLHIYLTKHAYGNASKEDFWNALQIAARKEGRRQPVAKIMHAWVTNAGYPVVSVKRVKKGFELEQERFTISGNMKGVWPIPITYSTENGVEKLLMDKKKQLLKTNANWIKLNFGQHGFYRVKYDEATLEKLGKLMRANRIKELDAWGVEKDLFSFMRSGEISALDYLRFVEKYCMDLGYPANSHISDHLNALYYLAYGHSLMHTVKKISIVFHKKLLRKLGWVRRAQDDAITVELRSSAIGTLGYMGDKQVLAKAKKMFSDWISRNKQIDVNIRRTVYMLSAWEGNAKVFQEFEERFKKEAEPDEHSRLLACLGNFNDVGLSKRALEFNNSSHIRLQDSFTIPAIMSSNPETRELVLKWELEHWKELMKKYGSGTHMLRAFVSNLSFVSDSRTKKKIEELFAEKSNLRDDIKLVVKQTLEVIDANIKFMQRNIKK